MIFHLFFFYFSAVSHAVYGTENNKRKSDNEFKNKSDGDGNQY